MIFEYRAILKLLEEDENSSPTVFEKHNRLFGKNRRSETVTGSANGDRLKSTEPKTDVLKTSQCDSAIQTGVNLVNLSFVLANIVSL